MLERWYKIAGIAVAVVIVLSAVWGPSVGGIFWLAQLDSDVERLQEDVEQLQSDVEQLQSDVEQLQSDVGEMKEDIRLILFKLDAQAEKAQSPSTRALRPHTSR